jgi:hypothetical protein
MTRDRHYLWTTVALALATFGGFWFTYFGPRVAGAYPTVSAAVHVHGVAAAIAGGRLPPAYVHCSARRFAADVSGGSAASSVARKEAHVPQPA